MGSHRRLSETSAPELRSKLRRVVSGHEQMKIAFHQLKSQIRIGLFQPEEVFASLAIPLMKLVGLKTVEMANEDRFTTIIIPANTDSHRQSFGSGSSDRNRLSVKEDICAAKAAMAGKLVMEKQKDQLIQLIRILKRIETQVNARQSHMVQTLTHRRLYLHKFFHRAIDYLSTVDRVDHQTFRISVLKLLRAAFHEVGAVLGSVEGDVEELLQDLGAQMCDPMVEYVEGVKADLSDGGCVRLVGLVKEMAMAAREVRVELEAARNKASVAEASKFEALSRLREAEDNVSKLKECLKLLPEPNKASSAKVTKAFAPHKFLGMEKEQANDEKLLWALLEKKRKYQTPESPPGPSKLLPLPSIYKRQRSTRAKPTAVTRTYSPRARTTPRLDARIQLGSSPSATIQKAAPPKQISPKMHA
ncbi:hypothetical protein L3X38_028819 [Prunus dulcis]|uniref:Uncharacterized protein n=1 Tax=Prunus dulcis TaxID=3755 RepID=A0AAD4Z0S7_PRUDU|nr:hypothetical protein L3X38_028819 [Prunus dulcis]